MKKIIIFAALFELLIVPVIFPYAVDSEYSLEADANLSSLSFSQLQERIQSEIEFSRCLLKLYPDREQEWEKLIKKAEAIVSGALKTPPYSICHEDVKKAEAVLAPIGKTAKTYTIHCVGHAHIDMNWMWSWPETVAVTNDTFITVLKLMDEFPDFCFTQSQASVYEIVKKYNPELFAGIKNRVAEGRWEIAAVQWVEAETAALLAFKLAGKDYPSQQLGEACIKKAENENTVIIRLHETDGKSVRARVEVNQSFFGLLAGAEEVDLLERPSQKNNAGVIKGNAFSVDVPAYAIVTVKLSLENY